MAQAPSGARGLLAVAAPGWSARAALGLETIRAIHGLVAAGLEWHPSFAVATGTGGNEHFSAWCCRVAATAGVTGWPKRVRTFGLARGATGRAPAGWVIETATGVELLLATGKNERRIAIAARKGLVCVLHADSREKSGGKKSLAKPVASARTVALQNGCVSFDSSHAPVYAPSSRPPDRAFFAFLSTLVSPGEGCPERGAPVDRWARRRPNRRARKAAP